MILHPSAPPRALTAIDWRWPAYGLAALALGLAVGGLDMRWLLVGVAGAIVAVLAFVWPAVTLPILLFAVPFGSAVSLPGGSDNSDASIGITEILVALMAVAWLAQAVRQRRIVVAPGALAGAMVLLATLMAASIGWAIEVAPAVKECLKWLEAVLVMLVTIDVVKARARMALWLVGALLLAASLEALYGIGQSVLNAGPAAFTLSGALRAFGHFDQPNPFGGYLGMALPVALMLAVCTAAPARFRLFAGGATLVLTAGLFASQSRGAMLGVISAVLVLMAIWSHRTRLLLVPAALVAVLGTALAVGGFLPASYVDRISQAISYFGVFDVRTVDVTSDNFAVVERMAHWQAGWYMFLDHIWLGVGAGNYAAAYPAYHLGDWLNPLGHAHNYFLNTAAEMGVCGLALMLLVWWLAFRLLGRGLLDISRLPAGAINPVWRALLAGILGSLVVFSVHNLFDNLFVHSVNVQIGFLLGVAYAASMRIAAVRAAR